KLDSLNQADASSAANYLVDGSLEAWYDDLTALVPTYWPWTGVRPYQSNDVGFVKLGTYSARWGNGVTPQTASIYQNLATVLQPSTRYLISFWIIGDGAFAAGGTITVKFQGAGYTATASEQVVLNSNQVTATYTRYSFSISTPASIPPDFALYVLISSLP